MGQTQHSVYQQVYLKTEKKPKTEEKKECFFHAKNKI